MAWSSPMTAVANATFTAAQFNQYIRDNLNATAVGLATTSGQYPVATGANALAMRTAGSSVVTTSQTTTTTANYTDLTTPGPSVTVTSGTTVFVFWATNMSNSVDNGASMCSVSVSGASTVAANDQWRCVLDGVTAGNTVRFAGMHRFTGLTAGSNTFKLQYKVGSATGTGTFANRELAVFPL